MPTIKEGHHYPGWDINLPWVGEQSMRRYVHFHEDCKYDSAPYNYQDVNKLFGLSFGFEGVHHNSARNGWRWSNGDQCEELLAYCYVNGTRNWDEQLRFPVIAQVDLLENIASNIYYDPTGYFVFEVHSQTGTLLGATEVKTISKLPSYGLTHGLYWGGDSLCPHTMIVDISRSPL